MSVKKYNLTEEDYSNFVRQLENYLTPKSPNNTDKKNLHKLVLNISNICNLDCKYCYANGGSYSTDEALMPTDVAKRAIDMFYEKYGVIDVIQLFGGQPLTNMPLISYICEYVSNKFSNNKIKELPALGVVTNATLIDHDFIDLVKQYKIKVTVSFDGLPDINDAVRVFKDGRGTSDIVLDKIAMLKKETGEPKLIEVTYNKYHVDNNVSISDIIRFMSSKISGTQFHIAPVSPCENTADKYALCNLDAFVDSVDEAFKNLPDKIYMYSLINAYIKRLKEKELINCICGAGIDHFSVAINGDIYPCFVFTGKNEFKLGNIFDESILDSKEFSQRTEAYRLFNRNKSHQCKNCSAKNICSGCMGENYFCTGDIFTTHENKCDMTRKMFDKILSGLAKQQAQLIHTTKKRAT